MEQIAKITGVVCISVLSMGILYNLGHFPSMEKVIKFVIAIYIVLTCFKVAANADIKFDLSLEAINSLPEEYTMDFTNVVIAETAKNAEEIIKQRLDEKNISYNHVSVHILEQNGLLTTDKIIINCDDIYIAVAEECIKDFITVDTEIIIGE